MADTRLMIPLFTLGIILRHYALELCPSFFWGLALMPLLYFCPRQWRRYCISAYLAVAIGLSYAHGRLFLQNTPAPLPAGKYTIRGHITSLVEHKEKTIRFHFTPDTHAQRFLIIAKKTVTHTFLPGQRWELSVRIPPDHHYRNPGGTDYSQWLFTQGIHAQAYLQTATWLAPPTNIARLHQIRAYLEQKIIDTLGETDHANIISALTIGNQSRITEAQWTRFRQTGIIHLVSISGVHVTILAGLVTLFCRRLLYFFPWILQRWAVHKPALILGFSAALLYALLAGFSIPTQRTIFMLAISMCAILLSKNLTAIQIWLSALFAVLLLDPMAVLSIGFWLSFLCVGALILSSVHTLQPAQGIYLWIKSQWVVGLVSLPVLAIVFHSFPLLSPIANAVAIPVVSLFVTPLSLLGLIEPTGYLLHIAQYALIYQDYFLDYLLRMPHTYHFHAPPIWTLFPAILGTLLLLLPSGFPLRSCAWIGFLPLFLLKQAPLAKGQWQAVVIDVGQGLSVLVQTQHHHLIFDTGKKAATKPALMPVLHHYGVHQIDTLILSHDDNDHIGGADVLMRHLQVKELLSSLPDQHVLHPLAQTTHSCLIPQSWVWDDVHFTLMPIPLQHQSTSDNSKSCILKVATPHLSMLIPGDIGFKEEAALITHYPTMLDVDIVIAPHHGSKYASSTSFIDATSPRWAIFSAGRHNPYRHPHPATLNRYQTHGSHILRTDQLGAILIHSDKPNKVLGYAIADPLC